MPTGKKRTRADWSKLAFQGVRCSTWKPAKYITLRVANMPRSASWSWAKSTCAMGGEGRAGTAGSDAAREEKLGSLGQHQQCNVKRPNVREGPGRQR